MADKTKIEWCDASWNPVVGCSKISRACDNCYAERMTSRFATVWNKDAREKFAVRTHPDRLWHPLHWKKPRRIFVVSMGDLFHEDVPRDFISAIFGIMAACPQHVFQLLTKRPNRAREWFDDIGDNDPRNEVRCRALHYEDRFHPNEISGPLTNACVDPDGSWPLPNVMMGATVWDQESADKNIPTLLEIPAAKHFISVEPMLGPIKLETFPDHVIAGAETGPGKRWMDLEWAHSLRVQCTSAGVPFFFKKDSQGNHELYGETWEQFPKD